MDFIREVEEANERITPYVRRTPVEYSPLLSAQTGARVHLKLENLQRTGSFKFRGAMNKLLSLEESERRLGVVAASTGNHGLALATGAAELGVEAVVYAPVNATESKLDAVRALGAEVRLVGEDCLVAEAAAREHAAQSGGIYVSPYNDAAVVAGQGTIGLELDEQLEGLDAVFIAVGGGGLISGVGGALKGCGRDVRIIGASPENSAVMHASLQAGRILDLPSLPTLSDGTAGGLEAGAITFETCREVVDDFVLVSEAEIADAVRLLVSRHHTLVEGAAGAALASFMKCADQFRGRDVVVVLCGANIDPAVLKRIL